MLYRKCNFACLVGILCIIGCGGSEETPAPVAAPPQPVPVAPAPVADTPKVPQVAKNTAPKPTQKTTPSEQVDPELLHQIGQQGNFEVVTDQSIIQSLNPDSMLAYAPPVGMSPQEFQILSHPNPVNVNQRGQFQLPAGFVEQPEFGYDSSGWPLRILCQADQSQMAYVPAGVAIQGSNTGTPNAAPEHAVYLDAYYIDVHEVTNAQFEAFRKYLSDVEQRAPLPATSEGQNPEFPVWGILWRDALGYCEAYGKQLPTEAEWEKAARGAGGFESPWGFGRPAWTKHREFGQITTTMSYPSDKSPYGVFDMAGNVGEWVADWYSPTAYQEAISTEGQTPPNWEGPKSSEPKFTRTYKGHQPEWKLWYRAGAGMTER
ncbi:MAG: SUMF1/EgtB/PvdO family nonheme iron enzyme, partial [Planctomycetaceae bacterium]|nr:SUMF1/EgtB/PvdO family nonheme iron enzyme [Planctomycetaceae bacterium]